MRSEPAVESLVRLGLSRYQAMVYSALSLLGPSGVSEISRSSGVPRTKVYEVLEQLSKTGAVEFQAGRPTLYRAAPPSVLVRQLRDRYMASADEALKSLEYEKPRGPELSERDLVWTIKGRDSIRRKLSETISFASSKLIIVEAYPPELITSVAAALRSSIQRGVQVRAVTMMNPAQSVDTRSEFIEYRKFRTPAQPVGDRFDEILESLGGFLRGSYCLLVVDDSQALVSLLQGPGQGESLGISIKIGPIPMLQRVLFEEFVSRMTVPA